jgi:hypothetical protein
MCYTLATTLGTLQPLFPLFIIYQCFLVRKEEEKSDWKSLGINQREKENRLKIGEAKGVWGGGQTREGGDRATEYILKHYREQIYIQYHRLKDVPRCISSITSLAHKMRGEGFLCSYLHVHLTHTCTSAR